MHLPRYATGLAFEEVVQKIALRAPWVREIGLPDVGLSRAQIILILQNKVANIGGVAKTIIEMPVLEAAVDLQQYVGTMDEDHAEQGCSLRGCIEGCSEV